MMQLPVQGCSEHCSSTTEGVGALSASDVVQQPVSIMKVFFIEPLMKIAGQ